MKALSIQQPYAWLIANGYKDIENRDWTTTYRGFVLIHAGRKETDDFDFTLWKRLNVTPPPDFERGGIVGYATLKEVVTTSKSPWFRGRYGFVLTQRHPVPFIPLRGSLGLFDVPVHIEAQINVIRDERALEADMKDLAQIDREWRAYRNEGLGERG